jgi:hypothetical protein
MNFKLWFFVCSAMAFATAGTVVFVYLRQAVAEADTARANAQVETRCALQIPHAVELVTKKDGLDGVRGRVTESSSHYNQARRECYVEVATYEHAETPIFVRTLISVKDNSAVLWSVSDNVDTKSRKCFGADASPIECETADQRWIAFMRQ